MKKPLLFASLLLIFASCNNDATVANHVLMPLTETVEVDNLSDHIKEIEVVPIQESDAPLFMGVSKAVLDNNNNLHIVDYAGSLISIGNDGTLLPKTINRGRANNEYVAISDLAVSNSEELMLMESAQIKFFNIEDGSLSRVVDLKQGIPFDAVSPYKDGVYAFSAFPPKAENLENDDDFLLSVIDKNGNLIEQAVKREDCTFTMGNISQSMNNSYFLRPQSSNHIFYKLTNKGVVAEYKIDFEDKTIPARYYYDSANESMRTYMMSDYYKLLMDLHETAAALSFHASGPQGDDVWFVYDKAKKNGFRWINESEDMIMPIIASDKEWFYTIIEILEAGSDEINHGLLYDAILNTMPNDFEAGRMYIVKFKI